MFQTSNTSDIEYCDCCDIRRQGNTESGIYEINITGQPVKVECDMDTDMSGWTVIPKRTLDGPIINSTQNWENYENGFGEAGYSNWIGLENIANLTGNEDQSVRFDMESFDTEKVYASYDDFVVFGPSNKYKMLLNNYSGTAGDSVLITFLPSFFSSNGMYFSTYDQDNDELEDGNCAIHYKGGWWYNACMDGHPNGLHYSQQTSGNNVVRWLKFRWNLSLKSMRISIWNKDKDSCGIDYLEIY